MLPAFVSTMYWMLCIAVLCCAVLCVSWSWYMSPVPWCTLFRLQYINSLLVFFIFHKSCEPFVFLSSSSPHISFLLARFNLLLARTYSMNSCCALHLLRSFLLGLLFIQYGTESHGNVFASVFFSFHVSWSCFCLLCFHCALRFFFIFMSWFSNGI